MGRKQSSTPAPKPDVQRDRREADPSSTEGGKRNQVASVLWAAKIAHMGACSIAEALARLVPEPRLVVLMCGLAGSGKTTFSQELEARGFVRIGIDEIIWNSAGRYGLDYPPETYGEKVAEAREALKVALVNLLAQDQPVVVDSAFWSRAHRQTFAELVTAVGGRHQIVHLKVPKADLRDRLARRRARFDPNAAQPIDDQQLDRLIESFEEPNTDEEALTVLV